MGAAAGIPCQSEASEGSRGSWHWEGWGPPRGSGVQGLVAAACPWWGKGEGLAWAATVGRAAQRARPHRPEAALCCASRGQSRREGSCYQGLLGTLAPWL